jgi:hypothetical protein
VKIIYFKTTSSLTIKEFTLLVRKLLELIEKFDPEVIGVKPFFEILKMQQAHLVSINNPRIRHPLSGKIEDDRKLALSLAMAINTQFNAAKQSKISTLLDDLLLLQNFVKINFSKIYKSNVIEFETEISNFLISIKSTEELKNASKALGLDVYITELEVVKKRIDDNSNLRNNDMISRREIKSLNVRKIIEESVNNLLSAIELATVTNTLYDYKPLVTEIEVLYAQYRAKQSAKSTRKINQAIKKESAALSATTFATETLTKEQE